MARLTINASVLRDILEMVEVDYEECREEGCDFIGLYFIIESNKLIILFDANGFEVDPWIIDLDENEDNEWESFHLEEWAVLELIRIFKEIEDTDKVKVAIDTKNEKLIIEKSEEVLEFKLW
ncbi:MAG: hypothetical protein JHC31_04330 [Sulfurihydrogenibium sp.]|jgi:hypothetical protein|nr:hypothetical protein [Sulfurihydrogenibium sp.]